MACNGRQFNSIEEDVCQLVYVERAEVFKSEDVSLSCFVFPALQGILAGLFGLGRMLQELLDCYQAKPISHSSAVATWESLFGDFVGFMPRHCSISDLNLLRAEDLVNPENRMGLAAAALRPCCEEGSGCGLLNVVDRFLFQ